MITGVVVRAVWIIYTYCIICAYHKDIYGFMYLCGIHGHVCVLRTYFGICVCIVDIIVYLYDGHCCDFVFSRKT